MRFVVLQYANMTQGSMDENVLKVELWRIFSYKVDSAKVRKPSKHPWSSSAAFQGASLLHIRFSHKFTLDQHIRHVSF